MKRYLGQEYESRFWGGAYSHTRLARMPKDAPMRSIIESARSNYNSIRVEAGLPIVKDWSVRPEKTL